jgi:hypothetical protein
MKAMNKMLQFSDLVLAVAVDPLLAQRAAVPSLGSYKTPLGLCTALRW